MDLNKLNEDLSKIRGGYARFTAYGGLRTLSLEVSCGEREFNLICLECSYIGAPTSWGPLDLDCSRFGAEDVVLKDRASEVRIICHRVGLTELENDEPDEP